jgi:tRNA(adenine34) deaminase
MHRLLNYLYGKYLGCTLYVTLEPARCVQALYGVNFVKGVYKTFCKKMGTQLHPKTTVVSGILAK